MNIVFVCIYRYYFVRTRYVFNLDTYTHATIPLLFSSYHFCRFLCQADGRPGERGIRTIGVAGTEHLLGRGACLRGGGIVAQVRVHPQPRGVILLVVFLAHVSLGIESLKVLHTSGL